MNTNLSCTAFILPNGAFVTAGHCVDNNRDGTVDAGFIGGTVDFNVPNSTAAGCGNTDGFTRSYTIIRPPTPLFRNANTVSTTFWRDWAVFACAPDASGLPAPFTEGFIRPTNSIPVIGTGIRAPSFGSDISPPGAPADCGNASSLTLQQDFGITIDYCAGLAAFPILAAVCEAATSNLLVHTADVTQGSSGAPVIVRNSGCAVGVENRGGCVAGLESNVGIFFRNNDLSDAINDFLGAGTIHVDAQGCGGQGGTVFDPFNDVQTAVDEAEDGGQIAIVEGSYPGPVTFDKDLTILTPVGPVTIGE